MQCAHSGNTPTSTPRSLIYSQSASSFKFPLLWFIHLETAELQETKLRRSRALYTPSSEAVNPSLLIHLQYSKDYPMLYVHMSATHIIVLFLHLQQEKDTEKSWSDQESVSNWRKDWLLDQFIVLVAVFVDGTPVTRCAVCFTSIYFILHWISVWGKLD